MPFSKGARLPLIQKEANTYMIAFPPRPLFQSVNTFNETSTKLCPPPLLPSFPSTIPFFLPLRSRWQEIQYHKTREVEKEHLKRKLEGKERMRKDEVRKGKKKKTRKKQSFPLKLTHSPEKNQSDPLLQNHPNHTTQT